MNKDEKVNPLIDLVPQSISCRFKLVASINEKLDLPLGQIPRGRDDSLPDSQFSALRDQVASSTKPRRRDFSFALAFPVYRDSQIDMKSDMDHCAQSPYRYV